MLNKNKKLILEGALLLGLLPFLLAIFPARKPIFPVLVAGALYAFLRCRKNVNWRFVFSRPEKGWWKGSLIRATGIALGSIIYCLLMQADSFLNFPKNLPHIWVLVLCLYPILSVFPQEIIYRLYFFERLVAPIQNKYYSIIVGSIAFSWVHIIYWNFFALWGTLFAGFIFNWIYWKYKDRPGVMWRVLLEHSLYGLTIFTVGLGGFFFLAN